MRRQTRKVANAHRLRPTSTRHLARHLLALEWKLTSTQPLKVGDIRSIFGIVLEDEQHHIVRLHHVHATSQILVWEKVYGRCWGEHNIHNTRSGAVRHTREHGLIHGDSHRPAQLQVELSAHLVANLLLREAARLYAHNWVKLTAGAHVRDHPNGTTLTPRHRRLFPCFDALPTGRTFRIFSGHRRLERDWMLVAVRAESVLVDADARVVIRAHIESVGRWGHSFTDVAGVDELEVIGGRLIDLEAFQ
jgi:hypothetical protein